MWKEAIETAKSLEGLGIIGFLLIALVMAVWAIRFLYKEKESCAKDRLETTKSIGNLEGDVRALNAQLDGQEKARDEHRESMKNLHRDVLNAVVRGIGASRPD